MRCICFLAVLLVLLVCQVFSKEMMTIVFLYSNIFFLALQASSHQPAQRKSIRLGKSSALNFCQPFGWHWILSLYSIAIVFFYIEAVDYNPTSQTVHLNITLDQSDARRFVNNFQVQVLRQLGNCRTEEKNCSRRSSEVTVVQSRRICLAPLSSTAHINCHQIIPAESVKPFLSFGLKNEVAIIIFDDS